MRALSSRMPAFCRTALLWDTVRCVASDRKPRMEIVVPLMLLPWVFSLWEV